VITDPALAAPDELLGAGPAADPVAAAGGGDKPAARAEP